MMTPTTANAAPTPSGQPMAMWFTTSHGVGPLPSATAMAQANAQLAKPSTTIIVPTMPRMRTGFSGFTVSFIAWMGGASAALRAGNAAPINVTSTPTIRPITMSEMDGSVAPVNGSPIFASPMTISRTMPQPSAMPVPEPTRPSTTACTITVEKTCAGEAPMDRSSAYPRIDSRTIIEKVFAMMNEPTNSAMTANSSVMNARPRAFPSRASELRLDPVAWISVCTISPLISPTPRRSA